MPKFAVVALVCRCVPGGDSHSNCDDGRSFLFNQNQYLPIFFVVDVRRAPDIFVPTRSVDWFLLARRICYVEVRKLEPKRKMSQTTTSSRITNGARMFGKAEDR
jgi:hypothetical protein